MGVVLNLGSELVLKLISQVPIEGRSVADLIEAEGGCFVGII